MPLLKEIKPPQTKQNQNKTKITFVVFPFVERTAFFSFSSFLFHYSKRNSEVNLSYPFIWPEIVLTVNFGDY